MAIYKKKNEDGKVIGYYFSTYYKDIYGNSKRKCSRVYDRKRDCEAEEIKFVQEVNQKAGKYNEITLEHFYYNIYKPDKEKVLKESTQKVNFNAIEKVILPSFNKIKLVDITPILVRDWYSSLGNMSINYKNNLLSKLINIMEMAYRYEIISSNPAKKIKKEKKKRITIDDEGNCIDIRKNIWTTDELETFLSSFNKDNNVHIRYKCMFYVLYYTGIRIGELLSLKIKDIDFEKQSIKVYKSLSSITGKITTPKTEASNRTVYFDKGVKNMLEWYLDSIKEYYGYGEEAFLFGINKCINYATVSEVFRAYLNKCPEIKTITIHSLRHCRASYLISHGYNILFVSKQLGHADVSTTLNIYSSLLSDIEEEQKDRVMNENG